MKIVSIHQPCYLPWLGYFHKMMVADTFVILDHVQFEKNSFINRNRIVQPDGRVMWLTIPVLSKGKPQIKDCIIDDRRDWTKRHLKSILSCYSRTPNDGFKFLLGRMFGDLYLCRSKYLINILGFVTGVMVAGFGLKSEKFKISSCYNPPLAKTKSDLVLEICQREDADIYFSGALGRDYLDEKKFKKAGIKIIYQDYKHPIYEQHQITAKAIGHNPEENYNWPFVSHLSVIDLLLNHGPRSKEIMMENNITKEDLKDAD